MIRVTHAVRVSLLAVSTLAFVQLTHAQTPTRRDTIYLDALQRSAEQTDRRAAQIELLNAQSALRLQTIRNERLPTLGASASAQYLSDVASIGSAFGGAVPGGINVPSPYHDQYDASVTARQPLYDATRTKRVLVENAQNAESAARIRTALWQQRQQVNDAFYAVLLNDVQLATIDAATADLTARRTAAQQRVAAGSALPSETLLLDAELLKRQQSRGEIELQRAATLTVLSELAGLNIPANATLRDRHDVLTDAAESREMPRTRPEYQQFARSRDLASTRIAELSARDKPRINAIGKAGYGRPGLNPLGRSFGAYWTAGLQLEWSPFNYGRTQRDMQAQVLQESIIGSDEASFTASLTRATAALRGQIAALKQSLPVDDSIIVLRERVLRETRLRFDEGEVTSSDYVARLTELLSAQFDRDARRIRLHEARARYLTTIGREVR